MDFCQFLVQWGRWIVSGIFFHYTERHIDDNNKEKREVQKWTKNEGEKTVL